MTNYVKAEDLAEGNWKDILTRAGLDVAFFDYVRREGPCPLCGGSTRFRWYDLEGTGKHFCNHCGMSQSGFRILQDLLGCDFKGAAQWIRQEWAGNKAVTPAAPRVVHKAAARAEGDAELLEKYTKLWKASSPIVEGTAAFKYRERRLRAKVPAPECLRSVSKMDYYVQCTQEEVKATGRSYRLVGSFPGMLALVLGPKGETVNVWRWYLTPDGEKAPVPNAKKGAGAFLTLGSYAVRLAEPVDHLAVSEGVETAEAVMLMKGIPTWATLSKAGMERFALPEGYDHVRRVDFYGDNDVPVWNQWKGRFERAGNDAARKARDKMKAAGKVSFVCLPASTDRDFADLNTGM